MQVKIKKLHPDAVIPKYAKDGDAGLDLVCTEKFIDDKRTLTFKTGLAFEIPEGYVGLLYPRSSIFKNGLIMTNSVGVIDSGYRGEVMVKYYIHPEHSFSPTINIGDRCGQIIIIPYPKVELVESEELSQTDRGTGGHGSTGK